MKTLDAILTLLLIVSTVGSILIYKDNQTLNKRIDLVSCRIDIASARIDLLNGMQVERPRCLDDLAP